VDRITDHHPKKPALPWVEIAVITPRTKSKSPGPQKSSDPQIVAAAERIKTLAALGAGVTWTCQWDSNTGEITELSYKVTSPAKR